MKPTILVSIASRKHQNPVQEATKQVIKALGAEIVGQPIQGEVEADIAVTNSIATALLWVKETEQTSIIVVHFTDDERNQAEAFAGRFPGRVSAVPLLGSSMDDEMQIVPVLIKLIAKQKENCHA